MPTRAVTALHCLPRLHVDLGKGRVEMLCLPLAVVARHLQVLRPTRSRKIDFLMVFVALVWVGSAAVNLLDSRTPPGKESGYLARSRFRIGLFHIRHRLRANSDAAAAVWQKRAPAPHAQGGG